MLPSCGHSSSGPQGRRVFVVAFDGMDPRIVRSLMDANKLDNYKDLEALGSFKRLATSTPPHTPVAFSSIISGADPGTHQIFDFIHRHPNPEGTTEPFIPFFSTAETMAPETDWALSLGNWKIPLAGGTTELRRQGASFWDYLIAKGIDTSVYYLPSNYPAEMPEGSGTFQSISGMGTPDLLGGYGSFTFFGPEPGKAVGGGRFVQLFIGADNHAQAILEGPPNFLRNPDASGKIEMLKVPIDITRHPAKPVAKFTLSGSTVVLNEGAWSEWIPVYFDTGISGGKMLGAAGMPTSIQGMVRLYLKQVHSEFQLYVSPVNIDPSAPVSPISAPADFSKQMAAQHGRFCTVGIPEDTKALTHNALDEDEFISQCDLVVNERAAQFRQALADFESGCMFFYFGATDLLQHMFWRDRDERHPGRDEKQGDRYADVVTETYEQTNALVGDAIKALRGDDILIVFSDHGFTSFRRGFNLNSWLRDNDFLHLLPQTWGSNQDSFRNIDWDQTRAYGLGMNALYVNAADREKYGVVKRDAQRIVLEEIRDKLMEVRDEDGEPIVDRIDLVEDIYPGADRSIAPDMIVGYHDGYRASWSTILGDMPRDVLENNMDRWSGTHLISADQVPGMLLTSEPVTIDNPTISDIAPTILEAFGIATPQSMTGRPLFSKNA